MQVAERHRDPLRRRLTRDEMFGLPIADFSGDSGVDDNGGNVSECDGHLVVIDYGSPGLMYMRDGPLTVRGLPR